MIIAAKGHRKRFPSSIKGSQELSPSVIMECSKCNKVFTRPDNLKQHEETHNVEKRFKCSYCQKAFHQNSNKKRHERTCPTTKLQKPIPPSNLNNDVSPSTPTSMNIPNFPDSVTSSPGQTSTVSGNSKQGESTHDSEKRFTCIHCSKCFDRNFNKQRHERTCPTAKLQKPANPTNNDVPPSTPTSIDAPHFSDSVSSSPT